MSDTDTPAPRRLHKGDETARFFQVGTETVTNWLHRGYIRAYKIEGSRALHYDLDEIERAFKVYGPAKMRDGRKRGRGRVVPVSVAVSDGSAS